MKLLFMGLSLFLLSNVTMANELNFDEPCAEDGAYTQQAQFLKMSFDNPFFSHAQDEETLRKIEIISNANKKLAESMEEYCTTMKSLEN